MLVVQSRPRYYRQVTNSDGWVKGSKQDTYIEKQYRLHLTERTLCFGAIDICSIAIDSVYSRLQTGNWSLEPGAGSLLGNLV